MASVFEKFHEIATSPRAQMEKYMAAGKDIILVAPPYTPEEIIHSMGYVPMGVWGADMQLDRSKEYCPSFLCSIVQSMLELGIKDAYKGAKAIVIPSLCDTLKFIGENWKVSVKDIKFIPMSYPQHRKPEYGIQFTMNGYQRVIDDLTSLGGSFDPAKLAESNAVYNKHNAAMRKAELLLAKHPEVTAEQRSDLFKSAMFMLKEEHTALVEEMIAELEKAPESTSKLPVVVTGILTDTPQLNKIFDDLGMHIVLDDVCAQSRQYKTDTTDNADPLRALAEKWANFGMCSILYEEEKVRPQWIVDEAKARGAKGVVMVYTKFCDVESFDYVLIKKACEAADLPITQIEVDRQMVHFEQIRTNLETFRDVMFM